MGREHLLDQGQEQRGNALHHNVCRHQLFVLRAISGGLQENMHACQDDIRKDMLRVSVLMTLWEATGAMWAGERIK